MATKILTKDNFDKVITENEIVLVDFWAEWCGPCKSFSEIYQSIADEFPDIVFGTVDIEQEQRLAQDFHVRSIPQLMVFKEKVVIFSESGVLPASALKDLIQQAKNLDMTEVHQQIEQQESAQRSS